MTIAGESAGGLSVLAQLVSHGSRGLFQRAIVQSGAFALNQVAARRTPRRSDRTFADQVGCQTRPPQCLRHAPVTLS